MATMSKPGMKTQGFVGLKTSTGIVEEEFIRDLRMPYSLKIYHEMSSNDAVIGACLYIIETMIRKVKWKVQPAKGDAPDSEAVKFVESCMFDMSGQSWDDFICEVLSMLTYGFSFHEVAYKIRRGPEERDPKFKSKFTDGKIGWREMPVRAQTTLKEWTFDDVGNAIEFIQDPSLVNAAGTVVNLPLEGNLLFRTKTTRGNPEGWSLLRRAYRSWYFKKYIEELEGIGIERSLAGIPILQPPAGLELFDPDNADMVDLLNWATTLVSDLRTDKNHGLVLPADWTLELLSSKGNSSKVDTDTVIRRYDTRMAMSMLADVVLMGGDRTGSFALAETKESLLASSVQTIINSICNTLNSTAVPQLLTFNGMPTDNMPTITTESVMAPGIKEISLLLRSVGVKVGANLPLYNFLMNIISAPTAASIEEISGMDPAKAGEDPDAQEGDGDQLQDNVDNDFKQSDQEYI